MKISGRAHFMFFCIGFCLGVFIMNIGKGILLEGTGLFDEDTLYHMKYMTVDSNALFCYVLRKRILWILAIIVIATTYLGLFACRGLVLWYGMSVGAFLSALTIRYGIKGILLAVVSIFPQYILYVPAYLALLSLCEELYRGIYYRQGEFDLHDKRGMMRKATRLFGILFVIVIGCALEGYVNSALLLRFLKVF